MKSSPSETVKLADNCASFVDAGNLNESPSFLEPIKRHMFVEMWQTDR